MSSTTSTTTNVTGDCGPIEGSFGSSSLNKNLIPLESVMQDIYRVIDANGEFFTQDDALESAAAAAHHLFNYKFYETAACMLDVDNYRVQLPNYYSIQAVYYRQDLNTSDSNEDMILTTTVDLCTEEAEKLSEKQVFDLKRSAVSYAWTPAHIGHSLAAMSRMLKGDVPVEDCGAGMGQPCPITYAVKGRNMTISQCEGVVIVIYRRVIRDDDGKLLIPNVAKVNEAIRTYVLMEMHMKTANVHREGGLGMFREFYKLWVEQRDDAKAKMIMPNLPEWVSIVNETTRMDKNDPNERHFDSHWGPETMNFGHYSGY